MILLKLLHIVKLNYFIIRDVKEEHKRIGLVIERAWLEKNLDELFDNLASRNLKWYESVFDTAITTREAVIRQWENDLGGQSDIHVEVTLLDYAKNHGYHRCIANWLDGNSARHEIDAVFIIHLNSNRKIESFKPWYSSRT